MDDNVVYDQAFWDQWLLDFGVPDPGNGTLSSPNFYDYWSTAAEFQPQPSQPLFINGLLFEESNHPGAQTIRELPPPMSLGSGSVHEPVTFETSNTSSSSETFEALKETSAIRCPHEDCQYSKATFKRRSDLKRHSRKHEENMFVELTATRLNSSAHVKDVAKGHFLWFYLLYTWTTATVATKKYFVYGRRWLIPISALSSHAGNNLKTTTC
ncbi:hypothetical protein Vi05172_g1993 [Venturia inaequalis]|nr:hypothetical protein Vi05172_g1993 [Venturia inaequalis]